MPAMEPTTGIEPVNLFLTKEALYRLSYVGINFHSLCSMHCFFSRLSRNPPNSSTATAASLVSN